MPDEDQTAAGDEPQEQQDAKQAGKARGGPSTPPEPGGGKPPADALTSTSDDVS